MISWHKHIINNLTPIITKYVVVVDPYYLISDEKLQAKLKTIGFEITSLVDSIDLRYFLEYRYLYNKNSFTNEQALVITVESDINTIPSDILRDSRIVSITLNSVFPKLHYSIIEQLDKKYYDSVYRAVKDIKPENLGENDTADFVLNHVFDISIEHIRDDSNLLALLLRLHYSSIVLPTKLVERIVDIFSVKKRFSNWSIKQLFSDSDYFNAFIQKKWQSYIQNIITDNKISEINGSYSLSNDQKDLPFESDYCKVYMSNYFIENILKPIPVDEDKQYKLKDKWILSGVSIHKENIIEKINQFINSLETNTEFTTFSHSDWLSFSRKYAELTNLVYNNDVVVSKIYFHQYQLKVNREFSKWIQDYYSGLINLPPTNPVMVHHIPRYLSRQIEENKNKKIALIILDGISFDQWLTVQQNEIIELNDILISQSSLFAWIPTITSVSRQAIFSGKYPLYFEKTIDTTNKEENHWRTFWESQNIDSRKIYYKRSVNKSNIDNIFDEIPWHENKIMGLVIDSIDRIMHGMQLGSAGMHNQIKQWCKQDLLTDIINKLIEKNYSIFITSDHGNIEAKGIGRINEGVAVDSRGERVRIYNTIELLEKAKSNYPSAQVINFNGLPNNYYPLYADLNEAFVNKNTEIIGHGSFSIEEVIVPFISIQKK